MRVAGKSNRARRQKEKAEEEGKKQLNSLRLQRTQMSKNTIVSTVALIKKKTETDICIC